MYSYLVMLVLYSLCTVVVLARTCHVVRSTEFVLYLLVCTLLSSRSRESVLHVHVPN